MENWKEVATGSIITLILSLILELPELPSGYGKYMAYFGLALVPVLYIQFNKYDKSDQKLSSPMFLFALFLNVSLVLSVTSVLLVLFFGKI